MHELDPKQTEKEPDRVFLRAVRSLAWNRHLQPLVQDRLDRAEGIVLSQLLVRGGEPIQAGPFEVTINEDQGIDVHWKGGDNWRQLHLPDIDALIDDPFNVDDGEPL